MKKTIAPKSFYVLFLKRVIDIVLALSSVIFLIPIFIIIAMLIKMDSPGPAIYKQKRLGRYAQGFEIYKFRTMVVDADKIGPGSTSANDRRVTKIGQRLRRWSLDELPQLFNIIKGDMSIVGYRPGLKKDYSEEEISSGIFDLKPGLTGYAQVNGRSNISMQAKRYYEAKYAEDVSFILDVKIIFKTIGVVLRAKDSN